MSVAVVDEWILLFGGACSAGHRSDVLAYDPSHDHWSRLTPMPLACEEAVNAVFDQSVYLLGGDTRREGRLSSIRRFDLAAHPASEEEISQ